MKQHRNPCSVPPPVYHHVQPVKNAIIDLPIKMKGNAKCTSGYLLSLLEAQNNDIGAANIIIIHKFTIAPFNIKMIKSALESASQALLTQVKLHHSAT